MYKEQIDSHFFIYIYICLYTETNTYEYTHTHSTHMGHAERSWLRHYATSWQVTSSIPDEFTGFFN
jgi:hypothetical protein